MARKSVPTIEQEELYPLADGPVRREAPRKDPAPDDARLLDLDVDEESPFLRGQKRVSVRRGALPRKTATRLLWIAAALAAIAVCCVIAGSLYGYGKHSWRFRVDSSDDIEIAGLHNVTRSQVMEVMGGDIGRNIFFVPLEQRKAQLEQISWVESASVMRFVPNRLRIEVHERTPVAFARVGSRIMLIDAGGVLMELPAKGKYSFPVILGTNPGEPLSTRAARMKIYHDVISQLDSGGARYSQEISEVDLSDPDDVKVLAQSPQGEVLVHLGSSNYLDRYKIYVTHVQQWRQQFDKLESVDLRYDRQIIVNPELHGVPRQAPLSPNAARQAVAAGVKDAALVTHEPVLRPPVPQPSREVARVPAAKAPEKSAAGHKPSLAHPRPRIERPRAKAGLKTRPASRHEQRAPAHRTPAKKDSAAPIVHKPITVTAGKKPSPAIAKGQEQQ